MASTKVTLQPFNSLALVVGTQYNLVAPSSSGHYYCQIMNTGTGNVAISNASTVSTNDPNSFDLPPNLSISPLIYGPTGIWVAASAAANISVALVPR